MDPDIAGMRVGENNSQLCSWHWPGDDESILLTVTSFVNTTIVSIMSAAIAGLPDPTRQSESSGSAVRSPMEMVVCIPVMLPQFMITILLPDG